MKKIIILFTLFLTALTIQAQQVSRQQALATAQQFIAKKGKTMHSSAPQLAAPRRQAAKAPGNQQTAPSATASPDNAAYYIFNVGGEDGFVIVSGDERTIAPVLGYSDCGHFDQKNIPENMKAWLEGYAEEISNISTNYAAQGAPDIYYPVVEPLIKSQWNQYGPYNDFCPEYDGQKSVTGCVATAIAQIMYYWKYPYSLPALEGYNNWSWNNEWIPELPARSIDWNAMKDTYDLGETEDNVAWLMRYVGQAVQMYYTPYSSGANIAYSIAKDFGYNKNFHEINKDYFTIKEWHKIIQNELTASHPIYYTGGGAFGKHAFICDGCDGNGYYHFNWGWGGVDDGYFLLNVANGFGSGQTAAIGLTPFEYRVDPIGEIKYNSTNDHIFCSSSHSILNGRPNIEERLPNCNTALAAINEDGSFTIIYSERNSQYTRQKSKIDFSALNDGVSKLVTVFRPDPYSEWRNICPEHQYLVLTKYGDNISIENATRNYDERFEISFEQKGDFTCNGQPSFNITMTNTGENDLMGMLNIYPLETPSSPHVDMIYWEQEYYLSKGESKTEENILWSLFKMDKMEVGRYKFRMEWVSDLKIGDEGWNYRQDLGEHYFYISDENGNLPPSCENPNVKIKGGRISAESATESSQCEMFAYIQNRWFYFYDQRFGYDLSDIFEAYILAKADGYMNSEFQRLDFTPGNMNFNYHFNDDEIEFYPYVLNNNMYCYFSDKYNNIRVTIRDYYSRKQTIDKGENLPLEFVFELDVVPYDANFSEITDKAFTAELIVKSADLAPCEIYANDMTVRQGKTVEMPVMLSTDYNLTAFQCDIQLPQGVKVAKNAKNKYKVTKGGKMTGSHTLYADGVDGKVRVMAFSTENDAFNWWSEDPLFYLPFEISDTETNAGDVLRIDFSNVIFAEYYSNNKLTGPDRYAELTVKPGYNLGDVNDDGYIDVADVSMTVEYIMGRSPENGIREAADVNTDNSIDVADISNIISFILEGRTMTKAPARNADETMARVKAEENEAFTESFYCESIETGSQNYAVVSLGLTNANEYVSAQFDLNIPQDINITDIRMADGNDAHNVQFRRIDSNHVRVLVFSMDNEHFNADNSLLQIHVDKSNAADISSISLDNARIAEKNGNRIELRRAHGTAFDIGVTGIHGNYETAHSNCTDITTLSGQRIKTDVTKGLQLAPGVYVINNKKVIIK